MDRHKTQFVCRVDIGLGIIDQQALGGLTSCFVQEQLEDSRIRFVEFGVPRQENGVKPVEEGIIMPCAWKCFSRPVAQAVYSMPFLFELL